MTFGHFVIKNALRNKRRTGLTVLSIGFSLFLLIALKTFLTLLYDPPAANQAALRLAVRRSTGLTASMPIAYRQKIEKLPHIKYVMPMQWFGGVYKDPQNFFANFAVDHEVLWEMYPEIIVSEETKQAFKADRRAAVCGEALAKRYEWNPGDSITLKGTIFGTDLEFRLAGTFKDTTKGNDNTFFFRYDYFDEAIGRPGQIGTFWIMADSASSISEVSESVDSAFRNSPAETKTESEKAFVLGFTEMLGNIKLLIGSIALVIVFTMLLVAASTISMTIRERIREVAILKSIGYTRNIVLMLILGEAVFISLLGGLLGCVCAAGLGLFDLYAITMGFIPFFRASPETYGLALGVAVFIGIFSALLPGFRASALTISQSMRSLE